jgi:hypothetical protein
MSRDRPSHSDNIGGSWAQCSDEVSNGRVDRRAISRGRISAAIQGMAPESSLTIGSVRLDDRPAALRPFQKDLDDKNFSRPSHRRSRKFGVCELRILAPSHLSSTSDYPNSALLNHLAPRKTVIISSVPAISATANARLGTPSRHAPRNAHEEKGT